MKLATPGTIAIAIASLALTACSTLPRPENPQGVHGMIAVKSAHSAKVTMDKFEAVVKAASMNVFARVDHAAGAQRIGKTLRPTEVLIWGNPQGGTPLMECAQTAGIERGGDLIDRGFSAAVARQSGGGQRRIVMRHRVFKGRTATAA